MTIGESAETYCCDYGNARMASALAIKLCETADTWRKLVAPVAAHVAQELWLTASRSLPALARKRMLPKCGLASSAKTGINRIQILQK